MTILEIYPSQVSLSQCVIFQTFGHNSYLTPPSGVITPPPPPPTPLQLETEEYIISINGNKCGSDLHVQKLEKNQNTRQNPQFKKLRPLYHRP